MRKRRITILVFLAVGLGLVTWVIHDWAADPVERHRSAMDRLTYPPNITGVKGYFSRDYLRWNLQGRLTIHQVADRYSEHREKLVELGYLQRRHFPLVHRDIQKIEGLLEFQRLVVAEPWPQSRIGHYGAGHRAIVVTALPEVMPIWERLIRKFDKPDSDGEKPGKQGQEGSAQREGDRES